jgi:outer membrane protein insertion porin family
MSSAALLITVVLAAASLQAQTPKKSPVTPKPRPGAAAAAPSPEPKAATPTGAATRYPIDSIRITGNKLFPEAGIVAVTGLHPGDLLEERRIEAARDLLLANGAFTNVSFRYAPAPGKPAYALTFEVVELTQLFEYRFDRLDVDEAKLRAFLKEKEPLFGARIPGADNVLARFRAAVAEYLKSQNKPNEVAGRVTGDNGETFVLFSPPGLRPAVATVTFTGNKVIPLSQLQNTIHPVAVGSQYRESSFRELLESNIRPLYDARGRLRMKFTKVETKPSEGVKGLAVTVALEEGESYSFGDVTVTGIPGGEPELLKAAAVPTSEVADTQLIAAAQERLHRLLRANGHMGVTSSVERRLNDTGKICHLAFHVVPGAKYNFGKLVFQGLDLHGEHEMRRIWTMKTGTPFNAEYPDRFVTRVKEDKLFDELENLRAVSTPNERDLTVDVKLIFNERKPKILQ